MFRLMPPDPASGRWRSRRIDEIREFREVAGKAGLGLFEEREHVWVGELVADACSFLVAGDDPRALEDAEVLRDVLLRRLERVDQFLHRCRLRRKTCDEFDAQRLTEHAQALRDEFGPAVGEWAVEAHGRRGGGCARPSFVPGGVQACHFHAVERRRRTGSPIIGKRQPGVPAIATGVRVSVR